MPFIALATIGAALYTTNRQAAAASAARGEAQRQATTAAQQAERQIAAQREQANVARDRLQFEIGRTAEDRARVESEAAKMAQDLETQQRQFAETEANRMRQMRRGGVRSLLSQERLAPELGLGTYDAGTFGSGINLS
jgi:cell division protein FtsI/penicillin-binding protein 2